MAKLKCKSANHKTLQHPSPEAVVTRCQRCGKPTCSQCEGTDNDLRDVCDGCSSVILDKVILFYNAGKHDRARAVLRKWARRRWLGERRRGETTPYRRLLTEFNLDTPETGYGGS